MIKSFFLSLIKKHTKFSAILFTLIFFFSSFAGGQNTGFNGYNMGIKAYLSGDYVTASYYFQTVLSCFPSFYLNDKTLLYLARCYNITGAKSASIALVDSANTLLRRSKITDSLPNPWACLFLRDTATALRILSCQASSPLDYSYYKLLSGDKDVFEYVALQQLPHASVNKAGKIYASWGTRFGNLNQIKVNQFVEENAIMEDVKSWLNVIVDVNENSQSKKTPFKISTFSDLTILHTAKAIYYLGLEDYERASQCIQQAFDIILLLDSISIANLTQEFINDQAEFAKDIKEKGNIKYLNSSDYLNSIAKQTKSFKTLNKPVFVDKKTQKLYENLIFLKDKMKNFCDR